MLRAFVFCAVLCASTAHADQLHVPGLSPEPETKLELPPCDMTQDQDNCARALACIGRDGLWFDGQVRGWGSGVMAGQLSNGVVCGGSWAYGGLFNTARAQISCQDGLTASMIFYAQDSLTGTGIARGLDTRGRSVKAWTGENVLQFLTPEGAAGPELPCTDEPIPTS